MSVPRNNSSDLHLLRKITEEKVKTVLDNQLSTIINNSISDDIDEIINNINVKAIEDEILLQFKKTQPEKRNNITLNHSNYSTIIYNLNSNSSIVKLKSLQELLNALVIDTKQNFWPNLSQSLQKCIVSNNIDVFLHVLKIHHKVISFSNTFLDGYISLLKSTILLLNSHYYCDSVRLAPTLKLILNSHYASNKFLLHASRKIIDEIILLFIKIINFKAVLELSGSLDSKALWLQHFCQGAYIRTKFFETLQEIASPLIQHIAVIFIKLFVQENDYSKLYTCYFFFYFLKYQINFKFFPIQISHNETITPSYLIELIILKIEDKNDPELEHLLVNLFESNPHLINIKILNFLLEILSRNYEQNEYILKILTNLVQARKPSIIFEVYNRIRKGRHRVPKYITNIPQKIIEITAESLENDNSNILVNLRCCRSLLESHSIALIQINPSKLIINLQIFYKKNVKNISYEIRKEIFLLFNFFYSHFCAETFKLLGEDENIVILNDLVTLFPIKTSTILLNTITGHKIGFDVLKNNAGKLLQPHLERVWFNNEDENNSSSFIFLLLSLQFNSKTFVAILSDENEGTVVETDDKSVVFSELIEKTLGNNTIECIEECIGLLSMKVMIMNLNLLVHLQANHQMQEKLQELNNGGSIVNENSGLIHNIIRNLEEIGVVDVSKQQEIISENYELLCDQYNNELVVFLKNGKQNLDLGWILQARRLFKNNIDTFQPCMLAVLLENIPKVRNYFEDLPDSLSLDLADQEITPEDSFGITIIINIGLKQNLLCYEDLSLHYENLTLLIKQTKTFLRTNSDEFEWFTGVIFLICRDDLEQIKNTLTNFNKTPFAELIWMNSAEESDFQFKENFYRYFQVVLEENSCSYNALKILNMSPSLIVQSWLTQCFFNVLTFQEICKFLAFCLLYPIEFSIYYFVSIFRYLEESICALTYDKSIENIFKMLDLSGFHLSNYMNFIEKLSKQYRNFYKL